VVCEVENFFRALCGLVESVQSGRSWLSSFWFFLNTGCGTVRSFPKACGDRSNLVY